MAVRKESAALTLRWRLSPRRFVRTLFLISLFLFLAGLAGQVIRFATGDGHLWGFTPKFNLDAEMNVPTWFSSLLFALCGFFLFRVSALESQAGLRRKWRFLAWAFVVCSIDEIAACHEMLVDPVRDFFHTHGLLYFAWVIPAIALVVLMAMFLAPLLLRLPRAVRKTFFFAALVFFSGNIGMEMIGGAYVELHGPDHLAYSVIAHAEELLEFFGQILFIQGVLALLSVPAAAGSPESAPDFPTGDPSRSPDRGP